MKIVTEQTIRETEEFVELLLRQKQELIKLLREHGIAIPNHLTGEPK